MVFSALLVGVFRAVYILHSGAPDEPLQSTLKLVSPAKAIEVQANLLTA